MRTASGIGLAWLVALVAATASAQSSDDGAARVSRYDAKRDAAADIARAESAAAKAHKHVLLAVGGDWCKDCRELDRVFAQNPDLERVRDARYVLVKVFLGSENRNAAVLAAYPKIDWVPTLIELDERGRVVRMTPSTEFHVDDKLDPAKVRRFLEAG